MRSHGLIAILLSCLILTSPAQGALDLELTQGMNAAFPIAIVPFDNKDKVMAPGDQSVTQIITNDLQNSGEFRVKSPGLLADNPNNVSQLNFEYWRKQGVNDVLLGSINSIGGHRYRVSFQLIGLFNKATDDEKNNPNSAVLVSQSYTANERALRDLAHQISNIIYQKLIGVRGIFNTKIAYVLVQRDVDQPTHYSLEVSDADGFNPQSLLVSKAPIMSPAWSPDGKTIAYVSFEGNKASIYLQNIATGQRQLISEFPGINGAPAFSPDGKKLALVLTRSGSPNIYLFDLQTHALDQITHGYAIDTEPAWAPDGKSLLFTSNRGGSPQIYRYYFANHQIDRLTFDGNYNARASFFPDEKSIVMMHRETGMFGIAKQDLTSGDVQTLIESGNDESPSLSPNGKMVLYATQAGGREVLAVVSTDGRIKLRLPAREGDVREPAWSPYNN